MIAAATAVPVAFWLAVVVIATIGGLLMWACENAPVMSDEPSRLDELDRPGGGDRG